MAKNFIESTKVNEKPINLLWLWKNQPPVLRLWFALSGISIMGVYLAILIQI